MVTLRFILGRLQYVLALLPLLTFKRFLNLLRAIGCFLLKRRMSVQTPPIFVLSITNDCNYRCVMCMKTSSQQNTTMDYGNPREMDFEVLHELLTDHASRIAFVRLHGGEPLHYSRINELIDVLNENRIPFNIVTNGSLLTEALIHRLVGTYCVGIGISLDAATEKTYGYMREGGSLELVAANIDNLVAAKQKRGSRRPVLSASMCVFSFNVSEMSQLVRFCHEHHIPALSVAEGVYQKNPNMSQQDEIGNHVTLAHDSIREAVETAKDLKITFRTRFPSLMAHRYRDIPYHDGNVLPRNCLNLYASAWVMPDLSVVGCSSATGVFGSLREDDFSAIWNTNMSGYPGARVAFRNGKAPAVCEKCIYTGGFFT